MSVMSKLIDEVTYWADGTTEDRYGVDVLAAPILIKGRWEEKNQQVENGAGQQLTSNTVVYVDRDMKEGEYLAFGDHTTEADPRKVDARTVQAFQSTPDLRRVETLRKAYL